MHARHFLLLSSLALSGLALAGDPKPGADMNGKPGARVTPKPDAGKNTASADETAPPRPARKNRVRYTFPPSAKRM